MSTHEEDAPESQEEGESAEAPDMSVLLPGPEAPAEPFHAIMEVDEDGNSTGQLWGFDGKLMLFESKAAAKAVLEKLADEHYQLRGVSAAHLDALQQVVADKVPLFVIVGFNPYGKIEAMPLAEHLARKTKAGTPPPLPPPGAAKPKD
ncbi:MAG: hypothetical protein RBU37_11995 [Myxococcota bacterium]|nr:hypothetical protein [Myxococcota bacterium]